MNLDHSYIRILEILQKNVYFTVILLIILLFIIPAGFSEERSGLVPLHILAVNDFHGQNVPGQTLNGTPVGSIPVLGSYLHDAISRYGNNTTIIALPGDITGASPSQSGLLLDEPAILFYNGFVRSDWNSQKDSDPTGVRIVATIGNHEFDRGIPELIRLIDGGNGETNITHLVDPYPGAFWPVIVSNVYINNTGKLLYPAYSIQEVNGIPVVFIGAVTRETAEISEPSDVAGVSFADEAESINKNVEELKKNGIHAFVVLLHEGGNQTPYEGQTEESGNITGVVADIVKALDEDVDIVISAHTHEFSNLDLKNAGGKPTLVTQAYAYDEAYADINLTLDPVTKDIASKSASIIPTYADRLPGSNPDPEAEDLLNETLIAVDPILDSVITYTDEPITRNLTEDGESALYDLFTDAMRWKLKTDMAVENIGALRADIEPGNITTGDAYTILPFNDQVVIVRMTGVEIKALLTQQWTRLVKPDHYLEISGFSYAYDPSKNPEDRIINITKDGKEIDLNANYTIAAQDFLAYGGDGYSVMNEGTIIFRGPEDVNVFIDYLKNLPSPVHIKTGGRIIPIGNVSLMESADG